MRSTASMTVSPTLPQATAFKPAVCKIFATISTVVVFPFVPVKANHFCPGAISFRICQARSISFSISRSLASTFNTSGCCWRQPGEITTASKSARSTLSGFTASVELSSAIVTRPPRLFNDAATADPVTPAPNIRNRRSTQLRDIYYLATHCA